MDRISILGAFGIIALVAIGVVIVLPLSLIKDGGGWERYFSVCFGQKKN